MLFGHDISSRSAEGYHYRKRCRRRRVGRVGGSSLPGIDRIVMLLYGPENQREVVRYWVGDWPLLVAVKTPINRAVYRENHREGLKRPSRLQVMANSWGFCGLFPAKINRERISKEQGNRASITGKVPVIFATLPLRHSY